MVCAQKKRMQAMPVDGPVDISEAKGKAVREEEGDSTEPEED